MRGVMMIGLSLLGAATGVAAPEGTPQLGGGQGLEDVTRVRVRVETGERLFVCSSDDGLQERQADGVRLDVAPGAPNPIAPERQGAELIVYAPEAPSCTGPMDCADGTGCFDGAGVPYVDPEGRGVCGQAFAITRERGYCSGSGAFPTDFLEVPTRGAGTYILDFAGEPETLTNSGVTTRHFRVDVRAADGSPVPPGRVFSRQWLLNAHGFENPTNATFYAEVGAGEGLGYVYAVGLSGMRGFRYSVLANRRGLSGLPDRSWCMFGDPPECGLFGQGEGRRAATVWPLYLAPPASLVAPPAATISAAAFEDEAGTPSISPDGDGQQDRGVFRFTVDQPGVWRVIIDADGDGRFDSGRDPMLSGRAQPGDIEAEWDGTDAQGAALPAGEYAVEISMTQGEMHLPMFDIEDNTTGFVIERVDGDRRLPMPMFWDDRAVRAADALLDADDAVQTLIEGSRLGAPRQRRRWVQPQVLDPDTDRMVDLPLAFDTWTHAQRVAITTVGCARCAEPVDRVRIGPENEDGDQDEDGLLDGEEDLNGDGVVDPEETDPTNPDTDGDGINDGVERQAGYDPTRADSDGDGLPDGIEDANQDGTRGDDETDPLDPDSDGDGLVDGAEDRDGDGQRGAQETDPRLADTDGDGLDDGADPDPLSADDAADAMGDAAIVDMGDRPPPPPAPRDVPDALCAVQPGAPAGSLWWLIGLVVLRRRLCDVGA